MIGALALLVVAVAGGWASTYWFDARSPLYARLATGTFIGLTTLAFVGFGLATVIGLSPLTAVVAALVAALPLLLLLLTSPNRRDRAVEDLRLARRGVAETVARPTIAALVTVLYVGLVVAGVWIVSDRNFFAAADGLYIGNVNNLGDLPYHVQITTSFAYGDNYPPQNPVYAGSGFSYHYIADFLAATFVAAGASLVETMLIMNFVLLLGLFALVHRWVAELTGNQVAARIAPLLLAFSGGLGWLTLVDDARVGGDGLLSAFTDTDARYTIQDGIVRFGNAITTLLIPQRGLLLGMGLAVIIFTLLWRQLDASGAHGSGEATGWRAQLRAALRQRGMVVAGVLTGLLPIVHLHTAGVVLGTAFLLGLLFRQWREGRWRAWAGYVVATAVVALPVLFWTARGSQANPAAFVGVHVGWESGTHDPISFWLFNTGVFIPLLVIALAWQRDEPLVPRRLLLYTLPFVLWFLLPNFLRLAPWLWDNIKVLIYWWLGSIPVVALLLARLWEERLVGKLAAAGLALLLVFAGALDVARATVGPTYREFDTDGMTFADRIRNETPPTAVILTAPAWNTPVFLSGRPVFMAYTGFLFGNGLPYGERELEVRQIYAGAPEAPQLIDQHRISYVVLGPHERDLVAPNEEFIAGFPLAFEVGAYRLYATGR